MPKRTHRSRRSKATASVNGVLAANRHPEPRVLPATPASRTTATAESASRPERWIAAIALCAVFAWANWSGLKALVAAWENEPDYSHGYLVPPIALLFLWFRRDRFPGIHRVPGWGGLSLIGLSILLTVAGKQYFLNPFVHWSMIAWVGGTVWILAGRRIFWWALPAIAFLIFMVPLPYRIEGMLGWPLQRIATYISSWSLQLLGQPAIAEGNTIFLGENQLEVAHACSGLRMLVMVAALAMAFAVLGCRNWRERVVLILCIVPVALIANSVRIVATGMAYQYLSGEASKAFSHDLAGYIVPPVAALMMLAALIYFRRLIVETEETPFCAVRHGEPLSKGI
ncbi:MAG: exosortase/archaeosortase family protein [Pirellulales bacterium]